MVIIVIVDRALQHNNKVYTNFIYLKRMLLEFQYSSTEQRWQSEENNKNNVNDNGSFCRGCFRDVWGMSSMQAFRAVLARTMPCLRAREK